MICALTSKTEGIDISTLQEGQRLRCIITTRLARVISAELINTDTF